jgi:hypothetical protein
MADTLTLLTNQVQDVDGDSVFYYPLNGETVTFTQTGTTGGGNVYIDLHDAVFMTWTNIATLNDASPTANYTVASATADGLRARLAGGNASASVSVTAAVNP